jgi:ABC-type multidrug transport system ATPase subunit
MRRFSLLLPLCGIATAITSNDEVHWMAPVVVEASRSRGSHGGLVWHQLQVSTDADGATTLLQPTSGILRNGQVTGLLGPSGSGKTTFLSALASRTAMHVQGYVGRYTMVHNETSPHPSTIVTLHDVHSKQVAWLQQKDDFFVQLTVQETLELAAFLELPQLSNQQRRLFVEQTCAQLGLQPAMHRPIGEAQSTSNAGSSWKLPQWLQRSSKSPSLPSAGGRLSGGERRRLSVALELLTDKEMIIADEPTSGLDSAYSVVVMKLLHDLAVTRNIPAICSLHQPRSSIWTRLDAVVLMAPGGRICYAGPRVDVVPYFQSLGYTLPDQTNPAEFLIDLVSINTDDPASAALDEARIAHLAASFAIYQQQQWTAAQSPKRNISFVATSSGNAVWMTRHRSHNTFVPSLRWLRRIGALWLRSWRQNVRDVPLNLVRLFLSGGNALLLAGVFPTVRGPIPYINSIADRVALLSFGAINLCMMAYMKSITLFAQERPVVHREHIREQYTVLEYLVAKVLAELPIDMIFSVVFATILKNVSGLQIKLQQLISVFSLLTTAGASLGYLLGSVASTSQYATTSGIPVLVILMVVGVINPSGVDPNSTKPKLLRYLQFLSPFHFAIEALCLGEYSGVTFFAPKGTGIWSRMKSAPRMGGLALLTVRSPIENSCCSSLGCYFLP